MFDIVPYGIPFREGRPYHGLVSEFSPRLGRSFLREFPELRGFKIDLQDKGDHFLLEADLPGARKEDIKISLDGPYLTIQAQQNTHKKETGKNYICEERSYGSCSRSFDVSGIQTSDIKGKFTDGVLTLTLPKKEERKEPEVIEIEIED